MIDLCAQDSFVELFRLAHVEAAKARPAVPPVTAAPAVPPLASTGSGALPPGARGVTADGGATTSPGAPLIAVIVPATGAMMTVSSTSRCAMATPA